MSNATVTVPRKTLEWLLKYANEERDVDYESNYSPAEKRVVPRETRRRIEKFDKVAAEIRTLLG